jgi:hypothetical protein
MGSLELTLHPQEDGAHQKAVHAILSHEPVHDAVRQNPCISQHHAGAGLGLVVEDARDAHVRTSDHFVPPHRRDNCGIDPVFQRLTSVTIGRMSKFSSLELPRGVPGVLGHSISIKPRRIAKRVMSELLRRLSFSRIRLRYVSMVLSDKLKALDTSRLVAPRAS